MPHALLAAILVLLTAPAAAAEAAFAMQVPAGESKNVRLRNLPLGALLMIRVTASGKLPIALISARQLKSAEGRPRALFRAVIDGRMSFKVVIPERGDYYLVLNNRRGSEALEVAADIRAERGRAAPPPRREHSPRPDLPRPEEAYLPRSIASILPISTGLTM